MDYQKFADSIDQVTDVLCVETTENGECGQIRIVAANKAYVDSMEQSLSGIHVLKPKFQPGSPYTDYLPRDLNYEYYCYQAAVEKKCVHSYVQPERSETGAWFHSVFFPLCGDEENRHYCACVIEIRPEPDASKMSGGTQSLSAKVLEMSLKIDGSSDFRKAMNDVIKDLRILCDAKRCCIILMDAETRSCSVLCEDYVSEGHRKPMSEIINDGFYDLAETWEATLAGSSGLIVRNEKDMELIRERNPEWYQGLVNNHVTSTILFPLRFNGELHGYMWATNFDTERVGEIKDALQTAAFMLGSEIANYQLLNRLQVLSSWDLLTGVKNRNEMNNYVDRLSRGKEAAGKPVGVIFADLNGLKYVNDREGHPAGDELLRNAAKALKDVFDLNTIYRAGGDEFTVIETDITEEETQAQVEKLREVMTHYDKVSFAVGWHVVDDAKEIHTALRESDEKMYVDKAKFYESSPDIMR